MTSISLKMVQVVKLSENNCHLSVAQLEISHELNGTTPKNEHRNKGPYFINTNMGLWNYENNRLSFLLENIF